MADSENIQNMVKGNEAYAASFTQGHLALPPAKKYTVIACIDARIDPAASLGIPIGDAHIIRNAGASAPDALRSLVISQQLLGTHEIILIKHTGCGMLLFTDADAHALVEKNLGEEGVREVTEAFGGRFLPFTEVEGAVERDVEWLRGSKAIKKETKISGWVYEVETGKVKRVV